MALSAVSLDRPEHSRQVQFIKHRPGELPFYQVKDSVLPYGMSLGNEKLWVTTKASGAVERVFSIAVGTAIAGSLLVTYAVPAEHLTTVAEKRAGRPSGGTQFTMVHQEGDATFELHPVRQTRTLKLGVDLEAVETLLVPKLEGEAPAALLLNLRLANLSREEQTVRITAYLRLPGDTPKDVSARVDDMLGALLARNESQPDWVRALGFTANGDGPVRYETTYDASQAYADRWARQLTNDVSPRGYVLGVIQHDMHLEAESASEATVTVAFSPDGEEAARTVYRSARDFGHLQEETTRFLSPALSVAMVETPDAVINEGVFWSKVNMLRVVGAYPQGPGFTNDPGSSSHIVTRDVVWYNHGCDYLMPEFARALLRGLARTQYENGMIVEAYDGISGERVNYGLNINDCTPLFIIGVQHHYLATADRDFLAEIYPAAEKAGGYLLSQRDDRGLVFCTAHGYGAEGITSWRNIIQGYQISGAVTEVNAESYAALSALGMLAGVLGKRDRQRHFEAEARVLKQAINDHLLNPENGMYYLNLDTEGNAHTEVTSDEVFPVMFGVADEIVSYRIVSRLNGPDFMTGAGLRTISRESPEYGPNKEVGLLGGVWPGVTFWYAFAAAPYHPAEMANALHRSYAHYLRDPLAHSTLPGEFSEWFDGETLANRGMRVSPWEPPRMLWAAIEGTCGVRGTPDGGCACSPLIPPDWLWVGLRRLPQGGRLRSLFIARLDDGLHVYTNRAVETRLPVHEYREDVSNRVHVLEVRAHRLALRTPGELLICLGSSADTTLMVPVHVFALVSPDARYQVRVYNSELRAWQTQAPRTGRELERFALPLDSRGFRLMRFTEM